MMTRSALILALAACGASPGRLADPLPPPNDPSPDTADARPPELYDPPVRPGRDLPPGTDVRPKDDPVTAATFAYIDGGGGAPALKYGPSSGVFNVVRAVRAGEVTTTSTGGQLADIDLGPLRVRVANFAARDPGFPVLRVAARSLVGLVVLRSYSRHASPNGPEAAALDMISVLPAGSTTPLATFDLTAHPDVQLSDDCDALAWDAASEVPSLAVSFPPFSGCSLNECVDTKAAWIRAWHDVWRVRQMIEFMAYRDAEVRAFLWSQPAVDAGGGVMDDDTSLAWWFGDYAQYRFDAIRWAYAHLWDIMHTHEVEGSQLDIECTPTGAGDICNTAEPPAHHAVVSNIKVCGGFWDESEDYRALLLVHEPLHHTYVPWEDNTPRLDPIMDLHTHGHGAGCGIDPVTNKGYGETQIRHLATYENGSGNHCFHKNYAFRNNDTYAWAARAIGAAVRRGAIHHWPAQMWPPGWEPSHDPVFPPCSEAGFEPPPPGWDDPLDGCHKVGQELVCPAGGSGVGAGHLPDFDLAVDCPPSL
ncbi:MAG TPA: hypothetical protein PKA64_01095 [Myxococcota bacterium]|nr:hypothetical protein [Myxococcota bacterium]